MQSKLNSLTTLARRDPALRFRSDESLGVVRHLRGQLASTKGGAATAGIDFLREFPDLFGELDLDAMPVLAEGRDPIGGTTATLVQRHGKHRVLDGSIRFHVDERGTLDTVSNRLFPDLAKVPREPRIDASRATAVVTEATGSKARPLNDPELVVVRHEGRPYLAWEVKLDTDLDQTGEWGAPTQWVAYVDASTGELLYRYDNIQTAGPAVRIGTGYYSGGGSVNAWHTDTTYQLRDTTRTPGGPEILTNDEDGASPSEDTDGNWDAATVPPRDAHQGPEVDAHRFSGAVVDYFRLVHGRNSFDGAGGTLTNLVHVGSNYSNGYWDGSKVNLGDGAGTTPGDDFECSDDWLAHEWTHAYTQFTCGLTYYAESGALNEAFSDIFAAFITGDWLVFEDTWLKPSAPAWRNMVDPTNGGQWNPADGITSVIAGHQPSHYSARYTGVADNAGVHINSGIINNLAYLLTIGGTHTVSGITVSGIGQPAAEQMFWRCMATNLVGNPNADFLQFREAMLDACLDLFPGDLFKLAQVKAAFNAVGIGPDSYVRDNLTDTGAEPFGGGYLWASPDIVNRTAQLANPAADLADLTDDALWENVESGQDNFVYVRLQNRGPQTGDATVNVYFSAATTFGTPASWTHIGTLTETALAPGSLRVTGPLTFPSASIPAPGHYCMIAVVSSTLDPAPDHTLISSVSDYLDHVRGTNNIAYRNMDVVDQQPGTPGRFEAIVRAIGGDVDGYALRIDDGRFVPGARILVRGPEKALRGAAPRGLRLIGRDGGDLVFELLVGQHRRRQLEFIGIGVLRGDTAPGFDRLRVDEEFTLRVDYELPERTALDGHGIHAGRGDHVLTVRQLWRDQQVGGTGLKVRLARHPA